MKGWVLAVVCGLVATCAMAVQPGPSRADLNQMAQLRARLVAVLKDADSAKFRDEFLSLKDDDNGVKSLCGRINAKNGYGGYTGFVRFVVTPTGMLATADETGGADFEAIWAVWCARPVAA